MTTKLNPVALAEAVSKYLGKCHPLLEKIELAVNDPLELLELLQETETAAVNLVQKIRQGRDTSTVNPIPFSSITRVRELEDIVIALNSRLDFAKEKMEVEKENVKLQVTNQFNGELATFKATNAMQSQAILEFEEKKKAAEERDKDSSEMITFKGKKRARTPAPRDDDDDNQTDIEIDIGNSDDDDDDDNKPSGSSKKKAAPRRSTRAHAKSNKGDPAPYNALQCIHQHIGNADNLSDLTEIQTERVIAKMSNLFMKHVSAAFTSIYFKFRKPKAGEVKVAQATKTRFESIPQEFAFSPEEKRRIYLTMKACFYASIPDKLTDDFKMNAVTILKLTFTYFFGLPDKNTKDEIFNEIMNMWNEGRLDNTYLKNLGSGFNGNLLFFAEDPEKFVKSIFQSCHDGVNHFIGEGSTEKTYGYYSYDYKTGIATKGNDNRKTRDANFKTFINSEVPVHYNDGTKSYLRYDGEKSLLKTKASFPFAGFSARAYRRFSRYVMETMRIDGMQTLNKKLPQTFKESSYRAVVKELKLNETAPTPDFFEDGEIPESVKKTAVSEDNDKEDDKEEEEEEEESDDDEENKEEQSNTATKTALEMRKHASVAEKRPAAKIPEVQHDNQDAIDQMAADQMASYGVDDGDLGEVVM